MGYIARLPEAVFNSLRSSTFLSDFAQIVEELVSNSIDAGSTKVHVSVDLGSSYIKVEDDGCGIKREDLTLLGERHATSKLRTLAELNAGIRTLGFRGEALSSLSDVALLEVTTRAHGNPNSYRKIIKGCKCLSLGLSGSKQGHGTTVIARDIFYSQPVRRRLFQSSPRKVLQSVRERILRIALIHPQVAFRVIDVDREEELVHTVPSTSPLCILSNFFGNDLTSDLREINFAQRKLRLSGFLSSSPHLLSSKGLQFFYINSRFVDKTPIHKLLNSSSIRVESILTPSQNDSGRIKGGKEKRSRDSCDGHSYPAYVLNLSCPHSSYDITYELSKTMVEFKDWAPVISFVDEVIQDTWGKPFADFSQGASVPQNDREAIQLSDLTMESLKMSDYRPSLASIFREIQESSCSEGDMQKQRQIVGGFDQSEPLLLPDNMHSLADNGDTMLKWITNEVLPSPVPVSVIECPEFLSMESRFREWNQSHIRRDCEDGILDVSSGALYLANSGLIPESMNKDCLMKAKVLQQVDRKYIAVVAQGNLAVIDQHAADERIRLEQLRKGVLEGVGKQKITVLEYEEELVLPPGGLQLLQNYSEQIQNWGWRYKILSRNEASLKRRKAHQLHRSNCKAILTAVPCILGVDLTAEDLSEYIRQLAQTDGSSAAPPAVLRTLSFKACRGAIMFGDLLLPSECALLVEELKRTSLCFQCAHGRPTTVPLVNLEGLHRELENFGNSERVLNKLEITNGNVSEYPSKGWHGLQKHSANLERTKMRLN